MNLEDILQIVRQYRSDDLSTHGNIPPKKLQNAKTLYPVDPADTAAALIDATVFGSAKCGMVIGLKGIYWKNDWTTPSERTFLSWEELAPHANSLSSSFMTVKLAPGCEFNLSGSSMKSDQLIGMLKLLCAASKSPAPTTTNAPAEPSASIKQDDCVSAPSTADVDPVEQAEAARQPLAAEEPVAPRPSTPPRTPKSFLVIRQPDQMYEQIKSLNTLNNVFNFAMAVLADNGKNTDATKAFQSYMVRALGAFRKHVVERAGIPELSNDIATMEAVGMALATVVLLMNGRRVPQSVVEQVLLEGVRATLNIKGTVQASHAGMLAMRLAAIYESAAQNDANELPLFMTMRLIGCNLAGDILQEYDLNRLKPATVNEDQLCQLLDRLSTGVIHCQEEMISEADLLVDRLLDMFPERH